MSNFTKSKFSPLNSIYSTSKINCKSPAKKKSTSNPSSKKFTISSKAIIFASLSPFTAPQVMIYLANFWPNAAENSKTNNQNRSSSSTHSIKWVINASLKKLKHIRASSMNSNLKTTDTSKETKKEWITLALSKIRGTMSSKKSRRNSFNSNFSKESQGHSA